MLTHKRNLNQGFDKELKAFEKFQKNEQMDELMIGFRGKNKKGSARGSVDESRARNSSAMDSQASFSKKKLKCRQAIHDEFRNKIMIPQINSIKDGTKNKIYEKILNKQESSRSRSISDKKSAKR